MQDGVTFSVVVVVVELLFMASVVAVISKRLRFPFTIGLVISGLLIGWAAKNFTVFETMSAFRLSPDIVLYVFLPVLLFQSAFTLEARALLKNIIAIYMLAVPALLISTVAAGGLVHYLLGLPIWIALLFGALISATDPVAVVALFKEMGAPRRLHLLVEGESLFNDGTALVVFRIILAIVIAGSFTGTTIVNGVLDFFVVAIGGTIVGALMGVAFSWMIGRLWNNPLVEIALSTILAHSSFIIADHLLHVSGVISTVVAGLVLGSYGRSKISPQVVGHMESFWEYFVFVCNSLIFLLVGLSIDLPLLAQNIEAILLGTVAVVAARAIAVYSVFSVVGWLRLADKVSRAFQTVIFWGGLRGALAIVMALSIPDTLEIKPFILALTLGIVLTNLLLNGLTVRPLITLLGLDRYSFKDRVERYHVILEARERARDGLQAFSAIEGIDPDIVMKKKEQYETAISETRRELDDIRASLGHEDEGRMVLRHCLLTEKSHYGKYFNDGMIREETLKDLQMDVDRQLDRLKEGQDIYVDTPLFLSGRATGLLGRMPLVGGLMHKGEAVVARDRYEKERVRLRVTTIVLKSLHRMGKQGKISSMAVSRAELIYHMMRDSAVAIMEVIWKKHPAQVQRIEERLLDRYCLKAEMETFETLFAEGAMGERVLSEMQRDTEERLHGLS